MFNDFENFDSLTAFDESPAEPALEGFGSRTVTTSGRITFSEADTEQEAVIEERPRFERRILSERERMIDDLYGELSAAATRLSLPTNLTKRVVVYDIHRNELELREDAWSFAQDYGLKVAIGTLGLETQNVERMISELCLDLLFESYESRDRLSLPTKFVDPEQVFLRAITTDRRELIYRSRVGLNYNPKLSIKLQEVCGAQLDRYIAKGFFQTIPEVLIDNLFLVPGWTTSRVLAVLDQGKTVVPLLDLIQLGVRLGHLVVEEDGVVSPAVLEKIDELLVEWFNSVINEEVCELLREAGGLYPLRNTLLPRRQRDQLPRYKALLERYQIGLSGESELIR